MEGYFHLQKSDPLYFILNLLRLVECSSLLRWSRIVIGAVGTSYSPASQSFTHLALMSFARRRMTLQYEISKLTFFLVEAAILKNNCKGIDPS